MKKRLSLVMVFLLLFSFSQFVRAEGTPVTGAIWTTNQDGTDVNKNIYDDIYSVFLNGGPDKNNGSLEAGGYYVRVTDPSGKTELGRSGNDVIKVNSNGVFEEIYNLWNETHFLPTPNLGGEYKVWISKDYTFPDNLSKTDNFKVKPNHDINEYNSINITKFYDSNVDTKIDGEAVIPGWRFTITDSNIPPKSVDVITGSDGTCTVDLLEDGVYTITEWKSTDCNWKNTTEIVKQVKLGQGNRDARVEFGNVYLGKSNPRTLGFWSNKNGLSLITTNKAYVDALNGLNLGLSPAPSFTFGDKNLSKNINTWLLGATAVDMKYMFRVQMATMKLNTVSGLFVSGNTYIWTGDNYESVDILSKFMTVNDLISKANGMLDPNPTTSWTREQLEYVKNIFDNANNNGVLTGPVFVQPNAPTGEIPFDTTVLGQ